MPTSISVSAIPTLKNTQTTRPGCQWSIREKKFDHDSDPE